MPDERLVVSDTSSLLNLALIGRLDLLTEQFSRVVVPRQVWRELTAGEEGTESLRSCRNHGTIEVVSLEDTPLFAEFRRELDVGEAATLAYAIEADADLVLLDEREARQAARRHDLSITGAIGILLRGADEGSVTLRAELDRLREAGFWISDELYEQALERVNGD